MKFSFSILLIGSCLLLACSKTSEGTNKTDNNTNRKTPPIVQKIKQELNTDILNFYVINQKIASSGKLTNKNIIQLAKNGFKTIIDLRTPAEGTQDERTSVLKLNMEYINIPVTGAGINQEQLKLFTNAINKVQTPILIHCGSGNRVGAMWATYLLNQQQSVSPEEIFTQARAIGLKPSLEEKVRAACKNC